LADLGISYDQSSQWQKLDAMPQRESLARSKSAGAGRFGSTTLEAALDEQPRRERRYGYELTPRRWNDRHARNIRCNLAERVGIAAPIYLGRTALRPTGIKNRELGLDHVFAERLAVDRAARAQAAVVVGRARHQLKFHLAD
jgi:hypothetical protein